MATTQEHIQIEDIKDGVMLLKDGGATLVLKTSAVNFGLLSPEEQMAIIGSFAQMLNSLSFAIQILIYSRRLDITSYLKLLDKALSLQPNALLAKLMLNYRQFVQSLIKDNEVLDKSFYIAVSVSHLEMGISYKTREDRLKKANTILIPRRDQVMRQLSRIGLKSDQLENEELIRLFYEIYNLPANQPSVAAKQESEQPGQSAPKAQDIKPQLQATQPQAQPMPPQLAQTQPVPSQPIQQPAVPTSQPIQPPPAMQQPAVTPQPAPQTMAPPQPAAPAQPQVVPPSQIQPQQRPRSHPFVVEELTESP